MKIDERTQSITHYDSQSESDPDAAPRTNVYFFLLPLRRLSTIAPFGLGLAAALTGPPPPPPASRSARACLMCPHQHPAAPVTATVTTSPPAAAARTKKAE